MQGNFTKPYIVDNPSGPLWNRIYSADVTTESCKQLNETLNILDIKRMVVAHTPQDQGINSACNKKVWRIDTGLSSFYNGKLQALEILNDSKINILE